MKRSDRLFIFHFGSAELYPPVMNTVNYLGGIKKNFKIYLFTTYSPVSVRHYQSPRENVKIVRLGTIGNHSSQIIKWWVYCSFNFIGLLWLFFLRPATVLYYESISSFAPVFYKRFMRRASKLFIHYHEYMTLGEYAHGMKMVRWFHKKEKKVYPGSAWLSHTNEERMQLFVSDNPGIQIPNKQIVPNYPPASWLKEAHSNERNTDEEKSVLRFVYIGALSKETMHLVSFAEWVKSKEGKVTWDIYSLNMEEEAGKYLAQLNCAYIKIQDGVYYEDLPGVLKNYDIGVILYNGHTPNWVHNVPNKLFEYHVCGLDVWFAKEMTGSYQWITNNTYPRIVPLDFKDTRAISFEKLTSRLGLTFRQYDVTSEKALYNLAQAI